MNIPRRLGTCSSDYKQRSFWAMEARGTGCGSLFLFERAVVRGVGSEDDEASSHNCGPTSYLIGCLTAYSQDQDESRADRLQDPCGWPNIRGAGGLHSSHSHRGRRPYQLLGFDRYRRNVWRSAVCPHHASTDRACHHGWIDLPSGVFSCCVGEREAERSQEFNRTLVRTYGALLSFGEQRLRWRLTNPLARRAALVFTDLLHFGAGPYPHGPGYLIQIRMTQEEFAELLGVARQTLNSLMQEWKRQGMVSYTRSCFCICNLEGLQKIVS